MNKFLLLIFFLSTSIIIGQQFPAKQMLNQKGMINVEAGKPNMFLFTDLGAWHGYGICKKQEYEDAISFRGSIFIVDGDTFYNPNDSIGLVNLGIKQKEKIVSFNHVLAKHTPGLLTQEFQSDKIKITQQLVYISPYQSLTKTVIYNNTDKLQCVDLEWTIKPYSTDNKTLKQVKNTLVMHTAKGGAYGIVFHREKIKYTSVTAKIGKAFLNKLKLKSGEQEVFYFTETFLPDENIDSERFLKLLKSPPLKKSSHNAKLIVKNRKRWELYFENIANLNSKWLTDSYNQRIAVKALQTLITNWRSPAKLFKMDGVFPCVGHFNGYWPWDSWKHAAALATIVPELAKNQIKTEYIYQNSTGMIPDVIRYLKKDFNWRNTKPPLSGWAIWEVYKATEDKAFLKEIYPKLIKFHNWWYRERDANQNGLCEYGSTDGTHTAAAWESGMDNAVRFDKTKVVKQSYGGTYDQESVDLNCYLWQEKELLTLMAQELHKTDDALKFSTDSKILKEQINNRFWDETTGFYYDWSLRDKKLITIAGSEGWTPLFVKLSSPEQAKRVMKIMTDPEMFNTYVPLGTLEKNHPKFDAVNGSWRGPIWLDQVYFGIRGYVITTTI